MKKLSILFFFFVAMFDNSAIAQQNDPNKEFYPLRGEPLKKIITIEKFIGVGEKFTYCDSLNQIRLEVEFGAEPDTTIRIYHPYFYRGVRCCKNLDHRGLKYTLKKSNGVWYSTHMLTEYNQGTEISEQAYYFDIVLKNLNNNGGYYVEKN